MLLQALLCLGAWMKSSAQWRMPYCVVLVAYIQRGLLRAQALSFFITGRKKHRSTALASLRGFLPESEVWIVEGAEEEANASLHLQAHAAEAVRCRLAAVLARIDKLDERIDSVGAAEAAALPLHAERVQTLFVDYLWRKYEETSKALREVKVAVLTADMARKCLSNTPSWLRDRQLDVLVHDEIENAELLEVLSLGIHFKSVITAGDNHQRLEKPRARPLLPASDTDCGPSNEFNNAHLPPSYCAVSDFLEACANNVQIKSTCRFGRDVARLLTAAELYKDDELRCRSGHATAVHLMGLEGCLWETTQQPAEPGSVSCVFGHFLFQTFAADSDSTIAVLFLYRASVDIFACWMERLSEEHRARVVVGTPDSVQGDTYDKVVALCLQRRFPHEKFQSLITDVLRVDEEMLGKVLARLGLEDPANLWPLGGWPCDRRDPQCGHEAASDFMSRPDLWLRRWRSMDWHYAPRAVPGEPEGGGAAGFARPLLVPLLPLVCYGHHAVFVPVSFVLPGEAVSYEEHGLADIMHDLCSKTAQSCGDVEHVTRHHKLRAEDVGGATYYAQACASVRTAHILLANGQLALKVYHGCGTDLQRGDVASLVVCSNRLDILAQFLRWLLALSDQVIHFVAQSNTFRAHENLGALMHPALQWQQLEPGVHVAHVVR
ncbi:unnamed protein product [Effrenium voratum]|uniref:DNA2/NAM7 helicase helicase domain-containing protein n=1 Tax=Effrenium voratum TaxID=2562239 RepID=A0AA36HK27_9DINO|nr:unnamed protein product [Effrenium voratum]